MAKANDNKEKELPITDGTADAVEKTEAEHAPKGEAASQTTHEQGIAQTVMNANINTTANMSNRISEGEMSRDVERAAKALKAKKKVTVNIPKQLAPTVGDVMISCINGACIRVPVDGEDHDIPEPYAKIIKDSLKTVNSGDVRPLLTQGNDNAKIDYLNNLK
jgi:hypothetical protein